jgi:hypothetical protein
MAVISVLYWNTQKSKHAMIEAVEASRQYDIIAFQEPWKNPHAPTTYCPRGSRYQLVHAGEDSRCAILINKKYEVKNWDATATRDWCSVNLRTPDGTITLYSIYSPIPEQHLIEWHSPIHHLATLEPTKHTLMVGDFNMHHPMWDGYGRRSRGVGDLLALCESWDLILHTPKGEVTRAKQGHRDSTIDHAWATSDLTVRYEGPEDYQLSDHRPQVVHVELSEPKSNEQPSAAHDNGLNWKMLDPDKVAAEAAHLWCPANIQTPRELECHYIRLYDSLMRIARIATPTRKHNTGRAAHWWNRKVGKAYKEAKIAERGWRSTRLPYQWDELQSASKHLRKTINDAKRESWRTALHSASKDSSKVWKLAKWARLHSHTANDTPRLPALKPGPGEDPTACSHKDKAEVLRRRFFPAPLDTPADSRPVVHTQTPPQRTGGNIEISQKITPEQVARVIQRTGAWKAPGPDGIPTGFLKACGDPLYRVLARLIWASLQLSYFPQQFRIAKVVVLRKSGKTASQLQEAGGWRPIALLNTLGKVMEAIVAERITEAAETHKLLPDNQMGNRRNRSTELAVRLLTDQIQTAWKYKATATLLQLDIKGAFDAVNHSKLLGVLTRMGFPLWLVNWVRSYLTDRKATLFFDGREAEPMPILAGVPQGSPLSPILFILFMTPLYEALERSAGISVIGFSDDTNLLAFSRSPYDSCRRLERAWQVCEEWAHTYGMQFAPAKSELIHFVRSRSPPKDCVLLGNTVKEPVVHTRFLGVWLDRKLRWKAHLREIQQKLDTQRLALTRLNASTWGFSLLKAREVYTKVIRAAIAYGAPAYHTFTRDGKKPGGITRELYKEQSRCLRSVAGAYRATAIRTLETETYVPPLDLYLNNRLVQFESRLEESDTGQLIKNSCARVAAKLRNRNSRFNSTPVYTRQTAELGKQWLAAAQVKPNTTPQGRARAALLIHWTRRWTREAEFRAGRNSQNSRQANPANLKPHRDRLKLHDGLRKEESALLVQMRTGKVGLRSFLFHRQVPEVITPICRCGQGEETPAHIAAYCTTENTARAQLPFTMRTYGDFAMAVNDPSKAACLTRWMMRRNRISSYRVAVDIAESDDPPTAAPAAPLSPGPTADYY